MGALSAIQGTMTKLAMWCGEHSAALYTSIGVSSGVGAVIYGIAITPENTRIVDNEQEERERMGYEPMTWWEIIKLVGPSYIPVGLLTGVSVACFILNTLKEERKIATLAGLYSMSEKSFEEYRGKVEEMFGKKKEQRVRDEVAADHAREAIQRPQTIILTGNGNYPVLIDQANIVMRSSQVSIERAKNEILNDLRSWRYISFEEVLGILDAPRRTYETGKYIIDYSEIGWNVDDDFDFIYSYAGMEDGEPMLVVGFSVPPHEDFRVRAWKYNSTY